MTEVERITADLDRVRGQIEKIETGGQALSVHGRSLTRADLEALYRREERLEGKLARAARGSFIRTVQMVPK